MTTESSLFEFEIEDRNLLSALKVLEELRIPYWLNQGSLLGLVRDGRLIEWDTDIDIAVPLGKGRLGEIYARLALEGFSGARSFTPRPSPPCLKLRRTGGRVVEFSEFALGSWPNGSFLHREWFRKEEHAKKFGLWVVDRLHRARMVLTYGANPPPLEEPSVAMLRTLSVRILAFAETVARQIWKFSNEKFGYFINASDVFPTEARSNTRGVVVQFPKEPKKVLTQLYGPSWTLPVQSGHWSDWFVSEPRVENLS